MATPISPLAAAAQVEKLSGANIVVPRTKRITAPYRGFVPSIVPIAAPSKPTTGNVADHDPTERGAFLAGIAEMLAAYDGANNNLRLVLVIEACLDEGINTMSGIIHIAGFFELARSHVAVTINAITLPKAKKPKLLRNDDGTYERISCLL